MPHLASSAATVKRVRDFLADAAVRPDHRDDTAGMP
jgi:hypothetical protein